MNKYELTNETINHLGRPLYRIRALKDFADVKAGDLGGYIEKESNLSQDGDAWVYGDARVYGDAWVYDNARIYDDARVYGDAWVYDNARIYDNAWVYDDAWVYGDARVCGDALVCDSARIGGDARISSNFDWIYWRGAGREARATTVFRTKDNTIMVKCDCFEGDLQQFEKQVHKTHAGEDYEHEYMELIQFAKVHFKI